MGKHLHRAAAWLAGLALLAGAGAAAAEIKIGVVNPAVLLEKSPQAEAARKRLEREFAPRDRELVRRQKELRKLEERLARDGAVMSESERRKLEREIRSRRRDIKRAQDEFREDFNIRRNEEFGKLQRQVYRAIVSLAKEEKFDLILGDGVLYAGKKVDITGRVLQRLKEDFRREQGGAGAKKQ
ncbi:MAG TPA: OmpH family outer membrane protein [Chromatiales bacterium]|nr:OmpH family outer membrane protein [Chromatiales bacterium]